MDTSYEYSDMTSRAGSGA